MKAATEKLLEQVLSLPPKEREEFADVLLHDREPDDEWTNAWIDECKRRMENVRTGQSQMIPAEDVFRMMDAAARPES